MSMRLVGKIKRMQKAARLRTNSCSNLILLNPKTWQVIHPMYHPHVTPMYQMVHAMRARIRLFTNLYPRTREARNARSTQQNRGRRHEAIKSARGKRQTPPSGNVVIAVIRCLDGSEFKFGQAYIDNFVPHLEGVLLRTLLVDPGQVV